MRRPILIAGVIGFVGAVIAGYANSQVCVPCLALVLGAAAGYLACRWREPATEGQSARLGGASGAVSGLGALAGHVVGGLIGAVRLGPVGAASQLDSIARSLGVTVPQAPVSVTSYYASALGSSACCGVFEVFVMAATGALAGVIWYRQARGKLLPRAGM